MSNVTPQSAPAKKLLDQVSDAIRLKHDSYRTQQTYKEWIKRYILFHNKRHPGKTGAPEIQAFLSHLATRKNVSASTRNQALSAILFLYRNVLNIELDERVLTSIRPTKPERVPMVLSRQEVRQVIAKMDVVYTRRLSVQKSAKRFRHSFATHLLQNGYDTQYLRSVQVSLIPNL